MSLRAILSTIATVGWVFATLGVLYRDATARDVGLLVAVAAVGLAVLAGESALSTTMNRPQRAPRVRSMPVRDAPPAPPASTPPAPSRDAPAAEPAPAKPASAATRAAWGSAASAPAWDADAAASVQEPVAVAPLANGNGNGNGHAVTDLAAPARPASGGDPGSTRGMCGKCRTPITVSNRRPLRVTCPVCHHSKVLT